jgi:hypothetical protein
MTKLCGLVGSWVYGLALVGVWVGCTPRTDIGVGPDEGSGGEGLSTPQAGSGGRPIDGEGGSPEGGSSGSYAGSSAAAGGDLAGGNGGSTTSGGASGSSGTGGDSGSTGTGGTTSGGTDSGGTTSGGTDSGGSGAQAGSAGTAGSAGSPPDLTIVKPTAGCGLTAPSDLVAQHYVGRTIETAGHREATTDDPWCFPGEPAAYDWSYTREYSVRLPSGYDPAKAYPVVLQGVQSCSPSQDMLPPVPDIAERVIHVHLVRTAAACPGSSNRCGYDSYDGTNSIEFPFYERVWQQLASELCFDQNRVFTTGWQSGGDFANQLGCVYAGHAKYPIRAVGVGEAAWSLPSGCGGPMAGMWLDGLSHGFYRAAIEMAMTAARQGIGCPLAGRTNYAVPGLNDDTCRNTAGSCPASASNPLVKCGYGSPNPGQGTPVTTVANLGFAHFFSSFFVP